MNSELKVGAEKVRLIERAMQHTRSNTDIEALVNRGLAAALLFDLETGIEIMSGGGVPEHVVRRVLRNTSQRRAGDWK